MEEIRKLIEYDNVKALREFTEAAGEALPSQLIEELRFWGYFVAPAGRKHHGAHPGGLMEHSIEVAKELCKLTRRLDLEWERPQSPIIIGLLHDVCKVNQYRIEDDRTMPNGYRIEYNDNNTIPGHGEASIWLLNLLRMEVPDFTLTQEEMLCIRYHMGAFADSSEWKFYSEAVRQCPNVLYTHMADMIASQIEGV